MNLFNFMYLQKTIIKKVGEKMDYLSLLQQIFEVCIIPLLGILTTFLVKYISDQSKEHKEEMSIMTEALNKNTQAILVMSEKIDELVKGK